MIQKCGRGKLRYIHILSMLVYCSSIDINHTILFTICIQIFVGCIICKYPLGEDFAIFSVEPLPADFTNGSFCIQTVSTWRTQMPLNDYYVTKMIHPYT